MKKATSGNVARVVTSGQADKEIVPDWSPCQNAAECVASRCRAILDDEGNLKAFECRAHGIFLKFDDAVQA